MHLTFLRSTVEQNRVRVMTKILQKKHSFYVLCLDGGKPCTSGGFDIHVKQVSLW